jgi:hypothetical protein
MRSTSTVSTLRSPPDQTVAGVSEEVVNAAFDLLAGKEDSPPLP